MSIGRFREAKAATRATTISNACHSRPMSLDEYVATQQLNFDAIRDSPHYSRLIETVDRMYRTSIDLVPAHCPRVCFGKMLLMCHKSLLSAPLLSLAASQKTRHR